MTQVEKNQAARVIDREKMAPWRQCHDADVLRRISERAPLPPSVVRKYLSEGNRILVERIKEHETTHGLITDPRNESTDGKLGFDVAIKQCVDSRAISTDLEFLLRFRTIHERTAGNIVRTGHVFKVLGPEGVGFVEGHTCCGAVGAAHQFHSGNFDANPDTDLLRILSSIPAAVATVSNETARIEANARVQRLNAEIRLDEYGRRNTIVATVLDWDNGAKIIRLKDSLPMAIVKAMQDAAEGMFGFARAEGMSFEKQYAHTVFMYDPYRLGRLNDPRIIFGLLPNEAFCVTFDFRRLLNGNGKDGENGHRLLSRTGLGSVKYAAFHQGGHVLGVGGPTGTRHICVLDPDEAVLHRVKKALTSNCHPEILGLTRNGETISLCLYDPKTKTAEFIGRN